MGRCSFYDDCKHKTIARKQNYCNNGGKCGGNYCPDFAFGMADNKKNRAADEKNNTNYFIIAVVVILALLGLFGKVL